MISAKVVADSKNEFGNRITTMVVTFPRIILAEFNTHRMFSRNSASSRAIPFEKMLKSVRENPFIPIAWQRDHKGMQGIEYVTLPEEIRDRNEKWLGAMDSSASWSKYLSVGDTTKQLCNRLLEPFMWHTVIVTATEWENFFALRCPRYQLVDGRGVTLPTFRSKKDLFQHLRQNGGVFPTSDDWSNVDWLKINQGQAEIHMMALAEAMWDAYNESTPKELKAGEWHIPYEEQIDKEEIRKLSQYYPKWITDQCDPLGLEGKDWVNDKKIKISTVMAARTSYTVVGEDQKPMTYENMIKLHDKMANANPIHASPFEHCAEAMSEQDYANNWICKEGQVSSGWSGNFQGFFQYRKMFENENITR